MPRRSKKRKSVPNEDFYPHHPSHHDGNAAYSHHNRNEPALEPMHPMHPNTPYSHDQSPYAAYHGYHVDYSYPPYDPYLQYPPHPDSHVDYSYYHPYDPYSQHPPHPDSHSSLPHDQYSTHPPHHDPNSYHASYSSNPTAQCSSTSYEHQGSLRPNSSLKPLSAGTDSDFITLPHQLKIHTVVNPADNYSKEESHRKSSVVKTMELATTIHENNTGAEEMRKNQIEEKIKKVFSELEFDMENEQSPSSLNEQAFGRNETELTEMNIKEKDCRKLYLSETSTLVEKKEKEAEKTMKKQCDGKTKKQSKDNEQTKKKVKIQKKKKHALSDSSSSSSSSSGDSHKSCSDSQSDSSDSDTGEGSSNDDSCSQGSNSDLSNKYHKDEEKSSTPKTKDKKKKAKKRSKKDRDGIRKREFAQVEKLLEISKPKQKQKHESLEQSTSSTDIKKRGRGRPPIWKKRERIDGANSN